MKRTEKIKMVKKSRSAQTVHWQLQKRMVRLLWLDLLRFHHPEADMKAWKSYSLTFPSIVIFSSGKSWSKKSETFTGSKEMSIWTFIKKIKVYQFLESHKITNISAFINVTMRLNNILSLLQTKWFHLNVIGRPKLTMSHQLCLGRLGALESFGFT